MAVDWVLFIGLAIVAIGSAIGLLLSRNAIYAALNLIINFTAVAIFYLILAAPFIALAQVAVYAGAIMVLFLFVVMLLGAERLGEAGALPWQRPLAYVLGLILAAEAVFAFLVRGGAITTAAVLTPQQDFGSPAAIGMVLYSDYLLPFEVVSILLLAAMIGAIVLTHKKAHSA